GFVLHMIVASADDEVRLGPDDLTADLETTRLQTCGNDDGFRAGMPDVGNRSSKPFPGVSPVGSIVVLNGSRRSVPFAESLVAPFRTIVDPIGRIGHHQDWPMFRDQVRDIGWIGGISASEPVRSENPKV